MTNAELENLIIELEKKNEGLEEMIKTSDTGFKTLRGEVDTLKIRDEDLFKLTKDNSDEIDGLELGGNYFSGNDERVSSAGTQAITGVGFKPKLIVITAVYTHATNGTISIGQATATDNMWMFRTKAGGHVNSSTAEIINTFGTGDNAANIASFDDDGFTLNWTFSNDTISFGYRCFG